MKYSPGSYIFSKYNDRMILRGYVLEPVDNEYNIMWKFSDSPIIGNSEEFLDGYVIIPGCPLLRLMYET